MNLKWTKGIISIVLTLILIMSMLPLGTLQVMAAETHKCTYENGFCTVCDGYEEPEILHLIDTYKYFGFENQDVALIRNAGNLYYYSTNLTSGYYPNAILMNDIVINDNVYTADTDSLREWIPFNISYCVFDGNGFEISGLYLSEEKNSSTGFVLANSKFIKNLGIVDSLIENTKSGFSSTGGICSANYGTISQCYFDGAVRSQGYYVGGITGDSCGTITDCYNAGTVTGAYESAGIDSRMGYWVDDNQFQTTTLTNSYNIGNIDGIINEPLFYSKNAIVATNPKNENLEIENVYYLDTCGADDNYAEPKASTQFASGELTELLNDGRKDNNAVWYQNEEEGRPDLIKKHLTYENLLNGVPLNPTDYCDKNGHSYKNGFCINPRYDDSPCNAYEPAYDSDGDGYYDIKNGGQLYWFADQVNNKGRYSIKGELLDSIYVNTNVINSDGTLNTKAQLMNWTPIGNTKASAYNGDFNGNGFKIYGLYTPKSTTDTSIGLFGISYGNIKNVSLSDTYFAGSATVTQAGIICGALINGTISNCKNENTIIDISEGKDSAIGGICGFATGANFTNVCNASKIIANTSNSNVGGVFGNTEYCILNKCVNNSTISVTGSENNIGGISGFAKNVTTEACYNTGNIAGDTDSTIGGVFGLHNTEKTKAETKSCCNEGEITGTDNSTIGGIIGKIKVYGTHSLNKCYNKGNLSGANTAKVGGICGITDTTSNTNNKATLTECYNTADIKTEADSYAGGICAESDKYCEINNCNNTGKISSLGFCGGITGKNGGLISISYNEGAIAGNNTEAHIGGISGCNSENGTIDNTYNLGTLTGTDSVIGGVCGDNKGFLKNSHNYTALQANNQTFPICCACSTDNVENCYYITTYLPTEDEEIPESDDCDGTTAKTADQFNNGEVAYLLNNKTFEEDAIWHQTIKTQAYPVFDGDLVYSDDITYSNAPIMSIFGDINLKFKQVPDRPSTFIAYADLKEGVYNFKIKRNKTELGGRNYCFDTTYSSNKNHHISLRYFSYYVSPSKLKATGGRYTFIYNTDGDYMFINYISSSDVVELLDSSTYDSLITLQKTTGTYYTALLRIDEPTTYNFRLNDSGTIKGGTYHFVDTNYKDGIIKNITYNPDWSGSTVFEMSGGVYALTYDQATSTLSIQHRVPTSENITIFGDFTLDLKYVNGSNNMYSSKIALNKGAYCFRIDKFGDVMCNGDIIQNETSYTPFSLSWDRPSIFQAEGGMYTFTYDANVNYLKIAYTPFDTENLTVDFTYQSVVLTQQGDSTIYTGTVNLYSDIHMFSINEFGTVYRSGWTYTNKIENAVHSSTLYNNTGIKVYYQYAGEYSIAYCTKTKRLSLMPITE